MRAVSLHGDVLVATSRLLATNCTIVRGPAGAEAPAESFLIDSPILPDELELLPSLLAQAHYPPVSGLLATHADWDHLLGPLAFPGVPLGCAESSAERLAAEPGAAQRELRDFDERLYITRPAPLALGSVQALPVPGRCEIGAAELELHQASGHTVDGMALWAGWASVLVCGDYLSDVEIPTLAASGLLGSYRETLERLRGLAGRAEHVVPGHGRPLTGAAAVEILEQDLAYLAALEQDGARAELPPGRRSREQRRLHAANCALL